MTGQRLAAISMMNTGGAGSVNINITRNWVRGSGGPGISISGSSGVSLLVIEKNAISNITAANTRAIDIIQASAVRIVGNDIESITGEGASEGIHGSGDSFTIEGNQILDARGTNGAIYGSTLLYSRISGNRLLKGSSRATNAIQLDSASSANFIGPNQTDLATRC